jgi:ABC-type maltose transport system permease subunit
VADRAQHHSQRRVVLPLPSPVIRTTLFFSRRFIGPRTTWNMPQLML